MSAEAAPYEGGAATRLAADPAYRESTLTQAQWVEAQWAQINRGRVSIKVGDRVRVTFERAPEVWPEHAARVGQTGEATWHTPSINTYVVRFDDGDAMAFPVEQLEVLA